ncbi:MAG: response regulator [Desulfatirhabdiaceae bacterium]
MSKKKILVVDDEMDMRIFVSTVLETSGYQTVTCRNGQDGVGKALSEKPDLIILDVMMPNEGGVQMYRNLKADSNLSDIPVIMLSAVGESGFLHYLGMLNIRLDHPIDPPAAYMEKPVEPDDLLKTVKNVLNN